MKNDYLAAFSQTLRSRFAEDSLNMPMSEWVMKNTKLRGKPFSFKGYEFQRQIMDDLHKDKSVIKLSQIGLALDLETPILTTNGWSKMGDLRVGDMVFDECGKPTRVEYVSPIYINRECYELEFDDGQTIVADKDHKWYVESLKPFNDTEVWYKTGRIPVTAGYKKRGVVTTELIAKHTKHGIRNIFSVPNCKSLQLEHKNLPVDPYFLGLWLGDGNSSSPTITGHKDDLYEIGEILKSKGLEWYVSSERGDTHQIYIRNIHSQLKKLGVLNNKHIPECYLFADEETRLEVLRGLIDSDGSIGSNGRASFYNCSADLVSSVEFLIASLGYKYHTRWRKPAKATKAVNDHVIQGIQDIAEVSFIPYSEKPVCRLERKRSRHKSIAVSRPTENLKRRVVSVNPVATRPVRCISVNSPNHLFLAGRALIPTHNTEISIRAFLAFLTRNVGVSGIYSLPDEKMFKRVSQTRVKPLIESEAVFNMSSVDRPIRSVGLYQIGQSFAYFTGNTEGDATSIPADILVHDEYDLSDMQMIGLFQSRLQNSEYKITHKFGTPTYAGYGIDASFNASDQHEYLCKCARCSHWNAPDFTRAFLAIPGLPEDIQLDEIDTEIAARLDLENAYVKCERCGTRLVLNDPSRREWVARYPGRISRGYRIRVFANGRLDIPYVVGQLLKYKQLDNLRGWYNTVLGQAYNDSNARLSETEIRACMKGSSTTSHGISSGDYVYVGIDVGQTCHITISKPTLNDFVVFDWRQVHSNNLVNEVEQICQTYNVIAGCMDRHPYTPLADEIRDRTKGKIIPVEYRGTSALRLVNDEFDVFSHAQAHRTKMIDDVASLVRKRQMSMVGYGQYESQIVSHLMDMVRIETAETPAVWNKLTGEDHYFHSLAFNVLARRMHGLRELNKDAEIRWMYGVGGINLHQPTSSLGLVKDSSKSISSNGKVLLGGRL